MKLYNKVLSVVLITAVAVANSQETTQQDIVTTITQVQETVSVVLPQVHTCACGPMEHWFFKSCVNKYIAQFAHCGLTENNDSEGLPENILQAMKMLVNDIVFMTQDGMPIVPELNAKGKLALPMSKNSDFKLYKEILAQVDVTTTLPAEELYKQWTAAFHAMKSA